MVYLLSSLKLAFFTLSREKLMQVLSSAGVTAVEEPVDCPNVSKIASQYASIFQKFIEKSKLQVWNRFQHSGFWRQLTVCVLQDMLLCYSSSMS